MSLETIPIDGIENFLRPWDIVWWVHDHMVKDSAAKPKIWVCVAAGVGGIGFWFFRVNSSHYDSLCVSLTKERYPFLDRDSFLGCGGDLIDVPANRIVGHTRNPNSLSRSSILPKERELALEAIKENERTTKAQRKEIMKALQG